MSEAAATLFPSSRQKPWSCRNQKIQLLLLTPQRLHSEPSTVPAMGEQTPHREFRPQRGEEPCRGRQGQGGPAPETSRSEPSGHQSQSPLPREALSLGQRGEGSQPHETLGFLSAPNSEARMSHLPKALLLTFKVILLQ